MLNKDWEDTYYKLVWSTKTQYPKFKTRYKDTSVFMKILSVILFFSKNFMTGTTTTLWNTVYYPSKSFVIEDYQRATRILIHERAHIRQFNANSVLFPLGYLFPQILVVFALLAIVNLWFLLFLLFILPWPAPWRVKSELEGYNKTVAFIHLTMGYDTAKKTVIDIAKEKFAGPAYYWMSWSGDSIEEKMRKSLNVFVDNPEMPEIG